MKQALIALFLSALAGCAVTPKDVVDAAQTPEQTAFALYGTFVVYEEQAAALVEDPRTPLEVRAKIKTADAIAKPLADNLLEAAMVYVDVKAKFEAAETTVDKLNVAAQNLNYWVGRAAPAIKALVATVTSAFAENGSVNPLIYAEVN